MRAEAHFGVLTSKRCADADVRRGISPLQQFEIGVSGPLLTFVPSAAGDRLQPDCGLWCYAQNDNRRKHEGLEAKARRQGNASQQLGCNGRSDLRRN